MPTTTREHFQSFGAGHLPGHLGVEIVTVSRELVESRMAVQKTVMAPNGCLHAASVVALADTSCGYGCVAALPPGASGFTTIELKASFLGTTRDGAILCRATPLHLGRNTRGVGRGGHGGDERGAHRAFPLHADGPLAQVDRRRGGMLQCAS